MNPLRPQRACIVVFWAVLLLTVCGCATSPRGPVLRGWADSAGAVFIHDVPFYPPASAHPYIAILDMVADYWDPSASGAGRWQRGDSAWGRDWRSPDALLAQTLRQRGVWGDWGSGDLERLQDRLTRGVPIWVFMQAAASPLTPALVVGWDADRAVVLLYGVEAYPIEISIARFAEEWERAGWHWVVAVPPDRADWPLTPEQHRSRGRYWMAADNYEQAAIDYGAALVAAPETASYYVDLGDSHLRRHQFSVAEPLYRAALLLDERSARAMNNLAYLLIQADGDVAEALSWARRATTLEPDNPLMLDTLGVGLHRDRQYPEAIRILQRARTRARHMDGAIQAQIAMHLVAVYEDSNLPNLARQTLADALASDPSVPIPSRLRQHLRPQSIVPRR